MYGNEIREAAIRRGLTEDTIKKIVRECGLDKKNWFGNTHDQSKNLTNEETARLLAAIRDYKGSSRPSAAKRTGHSRRPVPGFIAIFDPIRKDYQVGSCSSDGDIPTYTLQSHMGRYDHAGIGDAIRKCREKNG